MTRLSGKSGWALAMIAAAVALFGCVAEKKERTARRAPSDARPERLVLAVDGKFHDTDANGYGDTSQVFAYLFTDLRYELPIVAEGSFEFSLLRPDGSVLRAWRFDEAQTAERLGRWPVGPGFLFVLSLRDSGTDVLESSDGELVAAFTPRGGGEPIRSRLDAPISVGRARPVGASGWRLNESR